MISNRKNNFITGALLITLLLFILSSSSAYATVPDSVSNSAITAAGALHSPAFPHVARASSTALKLTWSKEPGVSGYVIYRATGDSKSFTKVKTINDNNAVSWTNKGLKTDKKYTYKLRSFVSSGGAICYSDYSYPISAVPYSKKSNIVNAAKNLTGSAVIQIGLYQTVKIDARPVPSAYGTVKNKKIVDPQVRIITTEPYVTTTAIGTVTGTQSGKTIIYALAHNGNVKKISVEVIDYLHPGTWMYEDDPDYVLPIASILKDKEGSLCDAFSYLAMTMRNPGEIYIGADGLLVNTTSVKINAITGELYDLLLTQDGFDKKIAVDHKAGLITMSLTDKASQKTYRIIYDVDSEISPGLFPDDNWLAIAQRWTVAVTG